jgi:hypothetical protein
MGFFSAIGKAISRPVRGIGRIARGKFKEGLGDIGSGAKAAAPFLAATTGIGALPAIAMGAGGGALEAGMSDQGVGGILKGAAGGAASAGTGAALRGIGGRLLGGAPDAAAPAMEGAKAMGGAKSALASVGSKAAAPAMEGAARGGIGSRLLGAAKGVGNWAGNNPEVAASVAGTGANAYGAYQEGAAADRIADLREEETRRGWQRQENMDPFLQTLLERLLAPSSVG